AVTGNFSFVGRSRVADSLTYATESASRAILADWATLRVVPSPESHRRLKAVQVNQIAHKAEAQGNAVGQQMHARFALGGLAGHVAKTGRGEQVAEDLARVGQILAILAAQQDHAQGEHPADDAAQ